VKQTSKCISLQIMHCVKCFENYINR